MKRRKKNHFTHRSRAYPERLPYRARGSRRSARRPRARPAARSFLQRTEVRQSTGRRSRHFTKTRIPGIKESLYASN